MTTSQDRVQTAQAALGVTFPDDYAEWLRDSNGLEGEVGEVYLSLFGVGDLVDMNLSYDIAELMPGLLLIGTNGGGEGVGIDVRQNRRSVVLVNLISAQWDEAIPQAGSFSEFMDQRREGLPWRWKP